MKRLGRERRPSTSSAPDPAGPSLGPLERLLLQGDGLTTTSIEALIGREITIRLRQQWRLTLGEVPVVDDAYTGTDFESLDDQAGYDDLEAEVGDELLVRRVDLVDPDGVVYAAAKVFAHLDRLPPETAEVLVEGNTPLGKLLVRSNVPVERQLRRHGPYLAADMAGSLGGGTQPDSLVLGRTYRMRSVNTGESLNVITEWFAPRLFTHARRT